MNNPYSLPPSYSDFSGNNQPSSNIQPVDIPTQNMGVPSHVPGDSGSAVPPSYTINNNEEPKLHEEKKEEGCSLSGSNNGSGLAMGAPQAPNNYPSSDYPSLSNGGNYPPPSSSYPPPPPSFQPSSPYQPNAYQPSPLMPTNNYGPSGSSSYPPPPGPGPYQPGSTPNYPPNPYQPGPAPGPAPAPAPASNPYQTGRVPPPTNPYQPGPAPAPGSYPPGPQPGQMPPPNPYQTGQAPPPNPYQTGPAAPPQGQVPPPGSFGSPQIPSQYLPQTSSHVRCPTCNQIMQTPVGAEMFRCQCGQVLRNPNMNRVNNYTSYSNNNPQNSIKSMFWA